MSTTTILTAEQLREARKLRRERPTVIPGTNVVIGDGARSIWYDRVTKSMDALGVTGKQIGRFCDIAGVPD